MVASRPDPTTMQVAAEESVRSSTSEMALADQALAGVGPPLHASLCGDGHHWPPDATRRKVAKQPTLAQALSARRRLQQQTQVNLSPAKAGSNNNTTAMVARSPYGNRSPHAHKQLSAVPANAHSATTHMLSRTVRHSSTPTPHRQPTPSVVHSVAWNTDSATVKSPHIHDQ